MRSETEVKYFKTIAAPFLLCGNKITKVETVIEFSEINIVRGLKIQATFHRIKNPDIRDKTYIKYIQCQ